MPKTVDNPMLSRREVAQLAGVSLTTLDKAIEQKVIRVHRSRGRTWLGSDDLGVIVLLDKTALPLPVKVKRAITQWVRETTPYRASKAAELAISDALVIRWSRDLSRTVAAAEDYARLREQWIEQDPGIKGGEPVIRGTRIGVRAVAQRLDSGDTLAELTEDYPQIPAKAFAAAYTYAKAHPRRGRPAKPWRDADEALGRRGPLAVPG